jgi:hypothetical protein
MNIRDVQSIDNRASLYTSVGISLASCFQTPTFSEALLLLFSSNRILHSILLPI